MISVKNLSKRFHSHTAVDNISFQVGKGQTLALLGTSGCGKTTTLRMLNRLTEPDSGDIIINGQSVSSVSPDLLRRGIGYVLQSIGLLPHYTIARNIAIVPELLGWEKDRIQERTLSLLQKLHLPEAYLNSYPHELSGGQQQRVGIARALAADPPLLLMDEPFSALDPLTRTAIRQDFKDLDELKDKTIVLVTHDVNEAVELADVICLMDKGAIVQTGTPKELLFSPANEFATRFFAEQKLLLQYKSVSLAELWPFFSADSISVNSDEVSIKTVFEAFSLLHSEGRHSITVFNEKEHTHKTIDAESLGKAFVHYKQALAK